MQIVGISNDVKDRILVGVNNRDPKWHDVHSLDLASGKLTPVMINTGGFQSFLADEQLDIRGATKPRPDGGSAFYRVTDGKVEAEPFEQIALEDAQTTFPAGFTTDGKTLYWIDSRGRDTAALIAQDVASGAQDDRRRERPRRHRRRHVEPEDRPSRGLCGQLSEERVDSDRPAVKGDLDFLKSKLQGEISVTSRTDADDKWIVAVDPVTAPSAAYLYDRKAKKLDQALHQPARARGRAARRHAPGRDQDPRRPDHGLLPDPAAGQRPGRRRQAGQGGADGADGPWRAVGPRQLRL